MNTRTHTELPPGWGAYAHINTGYRVNLAFKDATRSVVRRDHNEFWMIWTDLAPFCVFVALFEIHLRQSAPHFPQSSLAAGVHLGAILSRLCSCAYHIYNCCSLRANQRLIHLDHIGIGCMALGSPWLYAVAYRVHALDDPYFVAYVSVIAIQFAVCTSLCAHLLLSDADVHQRATWCQPLLVVLAFTGNAPVAQMEGASATLAQSAVLLFLWGYAVFYTLRFPEAFFPSIAFDGRMGHSHVLWHLATAGAQLCLVAMTFDHAATTSPLG
jgi:predicted membrane channel-forming protein YqfA (hemolysin III family)